MSKKQMLAMRRAVEELELQLVELRQLTVRAVEWNFDRNGDVMDEVEREEMNRILELWKKVLD